MLLAMFAPGVPEILVSSVIACFTIILTILPFWKIFEKAGFPGFYSLAMLVPLLNIFVLFYLAFADWPALAHNNESSNAGSQSRDQIE